MRYTVFSLLVWPAEEWILLMGFLFRVKVTRETSEVPKP